MMKPFTIHLENGHSFGIPPKVYQYLPQAAVSASELGSIEPSLLEPLEDGKPGVVCTLYGSKLAFSILVECAALPPVVVPSMVALDDFIPPRPVLQGADSCDVWRVIVSRMVEAEEL
jgi:hypothetical protein